MEHGYFYAAILLMFLRMSHEYRHFNYKISPLAIYLFCYVYFCFGPYLANMLQIPIYSGIQVNQLEQASFVFFLGVLTLSVVPYNFLARVGSRKKMIIKEPVLFQQICLILLFVPALLLFLLAFARMGFSNLDKVQRIRSIGIAHYVLLTLWPLILFCFFTAMPSRQLAGKMKWLFVLSVVLYFSYCFYMKERDIALLFLPLYFWLYKERSIAKWKLFTGISISVLLFTLMSAGRSSEFDAGGLGSFLNQGSNLMVTSNILSWLESGEPMMMGMSYISSFINMLTLGAVKLTLPLSIWFSRSYSSAANDGAYGFSIEGEALINFGLYGVPILFLCIGYFLARAYRRFLTGCPLGTLLTYYALFYFVYGIRGEVLILMKAFIYTLIMFFGLLVISQRGKLYFEDIKNS